MELKIIEVKNLSNSKIWAIGKTKLIDYVREVDKRKEDLFSFEVQRKIVKNAYLDKILDTIKSSEPIPFITLSSNNERVPKNNEPVKTVYLKNFNIIDGLQRTYRLWGYWKLCSEYQNYNHGNQNIQNFINYFKKQYPDLFNSGVLNRKKIKEIIENKDQILKSYRKFDIYFSVWFNLDNKEIIKKMLLLNAGQKPVSAKHQFELIFLWLLHRLSDFLDKEEIKILREKDPDFTKLASDRKPGQYAFTTIITSLLSLSTAKPQRVSTELISKYDLIEESKALSYANEIFDVDFIKEVLLKLKELDLKHKNNSKILNWLGKDTTMTGLFAAIGKYVKITHKQDFPRDEIINSFNKIIESFSREEVINLEEFQENYNSLSGRTVNIGFYIRQVIQEYVYSILTGKRKSWNEIFKEIGDKQ